MKNALTVTGVIRESFTATIPHDTSLSTYFSKVIVRWLEHVFQEVLVNPLRRLEACQIYREIMPISRTHRAVSVDAVKTYCFGQSVEDPSRENYDRPFQDAGAFAPWVCVVHPLAPAFTVDKRAASILCTLMPRFGDWLQLEMKAFACILHS